MTFGRNSKGISGGDNNVQLHSARWPTDAVRFADLVHCDRISTTRLTEVLCSLGALRDCHCNYFVILERSHMNRHNETELTPSNHMTGSLAMRSSDAS